MDYTLEVDGTLVVPPPYGQLFADSNKFAGSMKQGAFVAEKPAHDAVRVMADRGLIPPIVNPASWYVSKGDKSPWLHQRETMGLMVAHKAGYIYDEMGCGKTLAALWAFDLLRTLKLVDKLLVITPLSTVRPAWINDAHGGVPHLDAIRLLGTKLKRTRALVHTDAHIYVVNHDGTKVIESALADWMRKHRVMVVVDEATAIAKYNTARSETITALMNLAARKYVMTATPVVQSLQSAHGLMVAINNDPRIPRTITAFRAKWMVQVAPHKWVPKVTALAEVQELMKPAVYHRTRDLRDLPPNVVLQRYAALTPEQDSAFNAMLKTMVYEHDPATIISAVNAAVQLSKLVQITCGILIGSETVVSIPPKHKLEELLRVIDDAQGKVLIATPFTASIDHLEAFLNAEFYPGCAAHIDGRVPVNKRDPLVAAFQDPDDPLRYLIVHPKAAGHGLTLTEADTTVWFAPHFSAEAFVQTNGRIDRPGQTRTTRTVLLSSSEVEREIYESMLEKRDTNATFVSVYNRIVSGAMKHADEKD